MAVMVLGSSVSALLGTNSSTTTPWASARSNGNRIEISGLGRHRIGGRLAVEKSGLLGDSVYGSEGDTAICELGFGRYNSVYGKTSARAEFFGGFRGGERGERGRVFFIPFGPSGRAGARGTHARSEWERRQRAQQEKFREMVQKEIKARTEGGSSKTRNSAEFSLLRELEKRLRAEEAGSRKDGNDETENGQQDSPPKAEEEGTTVGLGASTYELMKELEKRLKAERESQRATQQTQREGRDVRTGDFSSLYDYMKEWDREMREQRAKLEEQWRLREEGRRSEGRRSDWNQEERFRGRRRRHEESGKRAEAAAAASETEENVVEVEKSEPIPTAASIGPEHAQSNGTVVYLKNEANGAEIYLVGTSHISQKSVDEVRDVIERVKPDFVMVEMCRKRYENMERLSVMDKGQRDSPVAFMEQMVRMLTIRNVGVVGKIIGVGLSSFYKLLSYRGFHPGKEFQVAIEVGKRVGARIVLGDQDIDTTLKQLGGFNLNMSVEDAFKFFGQRMPEDIAQSIGGRYTSDQDMFERMRDRKIVRRFNEEMEKGAPAIYKALVSERNEVMVKALRNLEGKVVAVVGLAHMDGMEQLWQEANEKYLSDLSSSGEE
ncbi:unnamed protein product [Calypogeia fissa]